MTACSNNANDAKLEITIGSGSQTIEEGEKITWTINLSYDGAVGTTLKELEASCADTTIATVTVADKTKNELEITGVKAGSTKITVTATDSDNHKNAKEFNLTVTEATTIEITSNLDPDCTYWDVSTKTLYKMVGMTTANATLSVEDESATFEITSPSTLPSDLSITGNKITMGINYHPTTAEEITIEASSGETLTLNIITAEMINNVIIDTAFGTETGSLGNYFNTDESLSGPLSNGDKITLTSSGTPDVSKTLVSDGINLLTTGYSFTIKDLANKKVSFEITDASSFSANTEYFIVFQSGSTLAWFCFLTHA